MLSYIVINEIYSNYNLVLQLTETELGNTFSINEHKVLYSKWFIFILDKYYDKINNMCLQEKELEKLDNIINHEFREKKDKLDMNLKNNEYSVDYFNLFFKSKYAETIMMMKL